MHSLSEGYFYMGFLKAAVGKSGFSKTVKQFCLEQYNKNIDVIAVPCY